MKPVSVLMKGLIRGYQLVISPLLPGSCRYYPTCSQYGIEAISRHGPLKGGWLTLSRLGRCQPWGGHGVDPVPDHFHFFGKHHPGCGHGDQSPPAPRVSGRV